MLRDPPNHSKPFTIPSLPQPTTTQITISDIIAIRLALNDIKEPSDLIKDANTNLDTVIHHFTSTLRINNP